MEQTCSSISVDDENKESVNEEAILSNIGNFVETSSCETML
jgi:hypothetical protein